MKNTQKVYSDNTRRSWIVTVAVACIIALLSVFVALFVVRSHTVSAASGGSVTVHVYDASQNYNKLGGWFWLKGSAGKEVKISATASSDEKFFKEYMDGSTQVKNVSRTFDLVLTDAEVAKLKSGTQFGILICNAKTGGSGDFWGRYEKETVDVFVDLKDAFDANDHADIYYVRKDAEGYTNLEEALKSLEKIISARFTAKTASTVTVTFEATTPIASTAKAILSANGTEIGKSNITVNASNKCMGTAKFNTVFDFSKDYKIDVEGVPTGCGVGKVGFMDDVDFIKTYECQDTQDQELGCTYTKAATTFKVWAPFATEVKLNLYADGSTGDVEKQTSMKKRMPASGTWGGVWELTVPGDCKGKYYTYVVKNNGFDTETIDPYAKACGANGSRGMVVDLKSTDPAGWANDKHLYATNKLNADTPIVWEVSVSDFSSSADSGMKYKGKYLAFTEQGTTVPGTNLKTGLNYLKDLGITYVHLNPVYDFATVDEADMTRADESQFNWGYDPQNYNIPEGSFSTDPANGEVRINEFKQMVMALHNAGIGVIMDVVYNHTYATSGQALNDTVPNYYHRTDEKGEFTNGSGCSNETASERTMMRKYMVDSILYWTQEYHIDGFRFDLMGIHDITTLDTIRKALDRLDGGNGKKLLMYGEPWAADGSYVANSFTQRTKVTRTGVTGYAVNPSSNKMVKNLFAGFNNDYPRDMTALPERVAVFNDSGREGLRGNNDPGKGWANGNVGGLNGVMRMMEGGAGGSGTGMVTGSGARNVAYAAAHDNYTLWDQIRGLKHYVETPLFYDYAEPNDIKRCKLVASAYMMSTGISFMLAGDEMGRTKFGNENSYNSPSKLNQIVWSRQVEFKDLLDYNKQLIALRKQYSTQLFSYEKSIKPDFCWGNFGEGASAPNFTTGQFTFTRTQGGATLTMTLNPTSLTGTIKIGGTTLRI